MNIAKQPARIYTSTDDYGYHIAEVEATNAEGWTEIIYTTGRSISINEAWHRAADWCDANLIQHDLLTET